MSAFLQRVYGFQPLPTGRMSDRFWLATLLLVWCPVVALGIVAAAQAPVLVGTGQAFGNGMRIFGVLLFGVLIGLNRIPPPRLLRRLAGPALIVAIVAWVLT